MKNHTALSTPSSSHTLKVTGTAVFLVSTSGTKSRSPSIVFSKFNSRVLEFSTFILFLGSRFAPSMSSGYLPPPQTRWSPTRAPSACFPFRGSILAPTISYLSVPFTNLPHLRFCVFFCHFSLYKPPCVLRYCYPLFCWPWGSSSYATSTSRPVPLCSHK